MLKLIINDATNRIRWIQILVCVCFLLGISMSFPLWAGERIFPHIPIFQYFMFGGSIQWLMTSVLGLILIINIIFLNKWWTRVLLFMIIFAVFCDQMRLQPWVYIYFLLIFPLSLLTLKSNDVNNIKHSKYILNYFLILLIGIYVWSGLNKFTPSFIDIVYPLMLKSLFKLNDGHYLLAVREWGYLFAGLEVLIGIGLIHSKTRNIAVILAILMHLQIIIWVVVGNPNYTILPWNICMIGIVYLSSWNNEQILQLNPSKSTLLKICTFGLILLVWIMPSFNLKNKWDAYLSFNLYTERISHMYVGLRQKALIEIHPSLKEYFVAENIIDDGKVIDVEKWAFDELKVPVYPALRVHKAIGRYFCKPNIDSDQIMLVTYRRPFIDGNYEILSCKDCRK